VVKHVEYRGRTISITVLPEQGRWAYRVENGPVRMLDELRKPSEAGPLFDEAQRRAQTEVECIELKGQRAPRH
jgi:hypothetical protein